MTASRFRVCLLLLVGLSALPGCLLLNWSAAWFSPEGTSFRNEASSGNVLGKIPTSRTAVVLEIMFVERPINDPLLGSQLWDEVDQIGALPPAERASLAKAGFRVGRVGSNPPQALQKLIGLATDLTGQDEKRLVSRRVVLPSGAETEIDPGLPHPKATINLPLAEGTESKTFETVRGVFRMTAKQLQDGWARIEFIPEIHHGRMALRAVPVRGEWQNKTTQDIVRLYRQQFALDLNVGEMIIITCDNESSDSAGHYFFHAPEFTDSAAETAETENPEQDRDPAKLGIRRLLIVRLSDLSTAKSLYSGQ
jgi:hypothetical protein